MVKRQKRKGRKGWRSGDGKKKIIKRLRWDETDEEEVKIGKRKWRRKGSSGENGENGENEKNMMKKEMKRDWV